MPIDAFVESVAAEPPARVPGTAVFLTNTPGRVPHALLHNLKHNKVLHKRIIILTVTAEEAAHVRSSNRIEVEKLTDGFYRVIAHYGFMGEPNIPEVLTSCKEHGLEIAPLQITYFLSRETIIPSRCPSIALHA